MDKKSELLIVLICCQHGLDLGISGWMSGISERLMSKLYSSWIVFLASMFNCMDLKSAPGFLQSMTPKTLLKQVIILWINWETVRNLSSRMH